MSATTSPAPNLRRLAPGDDSLFDQLHSIYVDVFPASERKSRAALRSMLASPDYHFLVELEHAAVVDFAIVRGLRGVDAVLLEYMGVRRNAQGVGRGSRLFRAIVNHPAFAGAYVLLEVEDERGTDPRGIMARRKRFYRSLDCVEVEGLHYIMPTVSDSTPPAMNLLLHRPSKVSALPRPVVADWLLAIYTQVYSRPSDDYNFVKMVDNLPREVRLI